MHVRVFTAFSGYDSQCLGLERLKDYSDSFSYELIGWSEIDRAACEAHNALFPQYADRNYGDISKIDWNEVPDFDLFTYSSPCQDFSAAGLQRGGEEGSGTRSSLLWECRKCIEAKRPKFLLFENVTALTQEKFLPLFEKWIKTVNSYGYTSSYQILSAKDYGIPQNRERLFLVSVRNDVNIKLKFTFPAPLKDRPHLYEILQPDSEVESRLWIKKDKMQHFMDLTSHVIDNLNNDPYARTEQYDVIPCGCYCRSSDDFIRPPMLDVSRTLKAGSVEAGIIYKQNGIWKQRMFTKLELFRLMGLTDDEFYKIKEQVKISNIGKMAGNSIVVNVLFHIFRRMFVDYDKPDKGQQNVLF